MTKEAMEKNLIKCSLKEICKKLEDDQGYHCRIHPNTNYIVFGDIDNYSNEIGVFITLMQNFLNVYYDIQIKLGDIYYTQNIGKKESYHFSIPKLYCSCEKLKEILGNFSYVNSGEFTKKTSTRTIKSIDLSIYSEHWFRYPNQSKNGDEKMKHKIIYGSTVNFIVEYIPKNSICIENKIFNNGVSYGSNETKKSANKSLTSKNITKNGLTNKTISIDTSKKKMSNNNSSNNTSIKNTTSNKTNKTNKTNNTSSNKTNKTSSNITNKTNSNKPKQKPQKIDIANEQEIEEIEEKRDEELMNSINDYLHENNINHEIVNLLNTSKYYRAYFKYIQFFDKCFKTDRFNNYNDWISVGMALMNIYGNDGFQVFDYFSTKGENYDGIDQTLKKYNSFQENHVNGYTLATIYSYAKTDNEEEYNKIMFKKELKFNDMDFAHQLKENAGNLFITKRLKENSYTFYCFNGKYWENSSRLLSLYISSTLYLYYVNLIISSPLETELKKKYLKAVEKLNRVSTMEAIVKGYSLLAYSPHIVFDEKHWLFAFDNMLYDLKEHKFREFRFEDYISVTTGNNWVEPTEEQTKLVTDLLNKIMPIEEERKAYLQLQSTCLEGRNLEKFIIHNSSGRNGKGLLNDLLLSALGKYGFVANSSILFESNKTGSCPEKANMHKKRFVVFREPPQDCKYQNSVIKEMTGGGMLCARGHNESETEKSLHATVIVECNNRPLFKEDPTTADAERLVDILFRSTFVSDEKMVDEANNIYKANPYYKTQIFQKEHRFALLKILMASYKEYADNNYVFDIPLSFRERTIAYLEECCDIYQWIQELFMISENKDDILALKTIYNEFKVSEYYLNLSRDKKRQYTYKYFTNYVSSNIMLKKYYKDRYRDNRSILLGWKLKPEEQIEE